MWQRAWRTDADELFLKQFNRHGLFADHFLESANLSVFPDKRSLERLVGAVLIEENEEWMEARRYISEASMAKLNAARPQLPPRVGLGPGGVGDREEGSNPGS